MKTSKKIVILVAIVLVTLIVLIPVVGILISRSLEKKIHERILSLNGSVSSVHVNLLSRAVTLSRLEWASPPDSLNSSRVSVSTESLSVTGIHILDAIFNRPIRVNSFTLENGAVIYNTKAKKIKNHRRDTNYPDLFLKNVSFHDLQLEIKSDTIQDFTAILNSSLEEVTLRIDSTDSVTYSIKSADVYLTRISIGLGDLYKGTISSIHCDTKEQKITIDSALLIPKLGKYEFARAKGEQVGRVNISLPLIVIHGAQLDQIADSVLTASFIEINSFDLYTFKDRRMPFLRNHVVPLPMEEFLKFAYKTTIDSIRIRDSRITIEEFPEKGTESGILTFEQVNATLDGLSNRITKQDKPFTALKATGLLMGSGQINAIFQLPLDGTSPYNAKGSIRKIDLSKLNPVVENLAGVRIESGHLNALLFNFDYTDLASQGSLELEYEDLRVTGLNKENNSTNEFKTFLLNAVVKNDKNRTTRGNISVARDRKRYIFNMWWISLLDGLKSNLGRGKKQSGTLRGQIWN